jgi:outer membrane lipoprotein carrier protein
MDFVKYSHRRRRAITSLVFSSSLLAAAFAWPQPAVDAVDAASASALLDEFVHEVQDLSARFEQRLFDADGELIEDPATGRFTLLRPDRFLWHYDTPYEQIIVADGESLWMYDVEFEQVTKAPLSDLATSPAMLLSGATTIRENYRVSELAPENGMRWVELLPIDPGNSDFISARIGFADGVPVVLELVDGLDQLTSVGLEDIEVNSGLTPDDFVFVPPAGVTVVGADGDADD